MKKTLKKVIKIFVILFILIIIATLYFWWDSSNLKITNITYINDKIPEEFNGYKIVQISDLHNKEFGKNQKRLIEKVKGVNPDIIVVTGDFIDRRHIGIDISMEFIDEIIKTVPVYYVSGNHEAWSYKYNEIKERLIDAGVKVLDDTKLKIAKGNDAIDLLGVSDPDFLTKEYSEGTNTSKIKESVKQLSDNKNFQILLSHRPELFDIYVNSNIDLVFTGHAHGGQIRIPFIGGLIAPDQGLFPKYTSGKYTKNNTSMIVSRGLGDSLFPIRVLNTPEIVAVTLQNQ